MLCLLLSLSLATPAMAAELRPETIAAWDAYRAAVHQRAAADPASDTPFLRFPEAGTDAAWRAAVARGEVVMRERTPPRGLDARPDGGLIHHWVGAVFVPGATVEGLVNRLQRFAPGDQPEDVLEARVLSRSGDALRVYLKLRRDSIVTVTYDTEHDVRYFRHGPARASSTSRATRIAELADAGTPRERPKPEGNDSGYLWRLDSWWRYEQVPGGVIVLCESLSLSRSIPFVIRPIAGPIVDRIARESLARTLRNLRNMGK